MAAALVHAGNHMSYGCHSANGDLRIRIWIRWKSVGVWVAGTFGKRQL